jgi:hypothetical protein
MKRLLTLTFIAAAMLFVSAGCSSGSDDPDVAAAKALAERVVGNKAGKFIFVKSAAEGPDCFTLSQEGSKIRLKATTPTRWLWASIITSNISATWSTAGCSTTTS